MKSKLPKKIRKSPIFGRMGITRAQEIQLDALWSKAVKARAGNRCEMCFKSEGLQSHHCVGRRNKSLRHIVSNGCCLCAGHHFYAEQNGIAFSKWIIDRRGDQWWNMLQAQGREVKVYKEFTVVKKYLEAFL